jgi:hypothetical protein
MDANFTNLNTDKIEADTTDTLSNKSIDLASNTVTGTKAQFDTAVSDGNICFDGDAATNLTMSTARLLGRTTASTGAVEEISVSGATLSGGTLTITPATTSTVLPMTVVSGTSQTAAANNHYVLTNALLSNVNLPAGSAGDVVIVTVANGLATNTITPNGTEEIEGSNTAMTLDITAGTVWLRYVDNTKDWRLM